MASEKTGELSPVFLSLLFGANRPIKTGMPIRKIICVFGLASLLLLQGCADGVRVRRGDTLYSIANKNDVPLRALIDENDFKQPYTLHVGQYVRLPRLKVHRVRSGDTLYSIARKNNTTVASLARHNGIEPPYTLKIGQELRLSSWDKAPAPAPAAGSRPTAASSRIAGAPAQQFSWPADGKIILPFGPVNGFHNDGINISGKAGAPIRAAGAGTVAYAGNELRGYGNLILIRHAGGWITAYAHAEKILVRKGEAVKPGQTIAALGSTGSVKTPQLHFEIRYQGRVVNPQQHLPKK